MESYAALQKKRKREEKKKGRALRIILIVLGAVLILLLGVVLFFYFKMKGMSRNAVPTLPTAIELPAETARPAELVDVDDPGYFSIPDDDKNAPLTDEELERLNGMMDDDDDVFDPSAFGTDSIYYVPRIDKNVINILILGNDAAASASDHGRSDVMQILSYNKATRRAKLVSLVRDIYIYIPGRDQWNRINTAFRFGGVGLAINTINVNFGLDIQHYIRVDFTTLPQLVDAVGGVDIELSLKEVQYLNRGFNNLEPVAGVHHINGTQALRYARTRSIGNHVWTRAERHNKLMYALLDRAKKEKNPVALMSLMYQLTDKLDTNMGVEEMVSLAVDVVFGGAFQMESRLLPFEGTWSYATERGMAVIKIDIAANRNKLLAYLY